MPVIGPPPAGTAVSLRLVGGTTAELDLTAYLNAVEGEGLDPADGDFLEPVFTDSPSGAGQGLVNIDEKNKELAFPLHLKAATKDSLHALVRTLRLKLSEPGVLVEWRDQDATLVTYYDLEFGRFEPGYRYHRARALRLSGNLHCWVRPYGHTATERVVGTAQASGYGAPVVLVGPLGGDADAVAEYEVNVAAFLDVGYTEAVAVGVLPSPSYPFRWPAASMTLSDGGQRVGASGAAGSQFVGRASAVIATNHILAQLNMPQAGAMAGRHRVLAIVRSGQASPMTLRLADINQTIASVTVSATTWSLVDFGIWDVPSHIASQAGPQLNFYAQGPSSALTASYRWQINEAYLLPEDRTALLRSARNYQHKYALDGINGNVTQLTSDRANAADAAGGLRGQVPAIPPGATAAIAVLRAPIEPTANGILAPSQSASVIVRARERFSFQR